MDIRIKNPMDAVTNFMDIHGYACILPLKIQFVNENCLLQTPALIFDTGRPIGITTKLDQSEQSNLVASTVTKESGFSDSYIWNAPSSSVLRKV